MSRKCLARKIHDGWSPYDPFKDAGHQQCSQHLSRRCDEMAAIATRGASTLSDFVMAGYFWPSSNCVLGLPTPIEYRLVRR
jgi:hypothetical protein